MRYLKQLLVVLFVVLSLSFIAEASLNSFYFEAFKNELLSYFPVIEGKVVKQVNNELILDKGSKDGLKKGQRIILFEQTVPLIHPVTKQVIGKSEKIIGSAEIIEAENNTAKAIVLDGDIKIQENQVLFKIPKSKTKIFYAQTNTEWAVGEGYYRELKESGRFELIDAPVNVDENEKLFKSAKNVNAEVLLILKTVKKEQGLKISQELYWVKDQKPLSKAEIELNPTALSELRKKYASLIVPEGHTLLSFRLSRSINRIATGNFDGISQNQILIASDNELSLYQIEVDLKLKSSYSIPIGGDILWFDTGDIDRDGKDEITITFKKDDRVISSIIKWTGNEFEEISRIYDVFLRIYDGNLIAQAFSPSIGFDGEVLYIKPEKSTFQKLKTFKMPVKANIYDFYLIGNLMFKWEEDGTFAVYNEKGVPLWRSQEPLGYGLQYEKQTGISMLSLGKWKVQSKIKPFSNGVIIIEKKPLLGLVNVSTLGYRSSKLQLLQWTGIGIEQTDITEEMTGEILDYSVSSDRLYVLVKPPFGLVPKRILQGESPFETQLHILSLKY